MRGWPFKLYQGPFWAPFYSVVCLRLRFKLLFKDSRIFAVSLAHLYQGLVGKRRCVGLIFKVGFNG